MMLFVDNETNRPLSPVGGGKGLKILTGPGSNPGGGTNKMLICYIIKVLLNESDK